MIPWLRGLRGNRGPRNRTLDLRVCFGTCVLSCAIRFCFLATYVRSHGREKDLAKQRLLPLSERADRLAERGRSGEACFVLQSWAYTVGVDEPELVVKHCRWCRRINLTMLGLLVCTNSVVV